MRTFAIMRLSQFLVWNRQMLESYREDMLNARTNASNLIEEKYARMMKFTAPKRYCEFEAYLPFISNKKNELIEKIIPIQIKWQQEYIKLYPNLASKSRPIDMKNDSEEYTSFESYLRGELLTFSEQTLKYYYDHVKNLCNKGINMTLLSVEYMGKFYNFNSIGHMEIR